MFKIPKKLNILGQTYTVQTCKQIDPKDINMGYVDGMKMTIQILKDLPEDNVSEVLLHEILHVLDFTLDLNLGEHKVNNLAVGLNQVLRNNNLKFYKERG